jgi:hypothetical protein
MIERYLVKEAVCLTVLILFCSFAHAGDTLYYEGKIIISKKISYNYILRFTISPQNVLTGYSLTDARGPNETKTKILGTYDSLANTISYEEKTVLRSKVDLQQNDLCFVKATLKFSKPKFFETLTGKFTGMQPGKTSPCANGEIKLIDTKKAKLVLNKLGGNQPHTENPASVHVGSDTAPDGFIKVFNNTARELPFTGNMVKLTIWDNGQVDGDRISIMLNGRYILENYTLDSVTKVIESVLPDNEIDTIKVIALNEGTLPPNTAVVRIESKTEQYPVEVQAKINEVRTIYLRRKK